MLSPFIKLTFSFVDFLFLERYNAVPDNIPLDDMNHGTIRLSQLKLIKIIGTGNFAIILLSIYFKRKHNLREQR